ncbi:putative toxin-antitoxin system toxin component, PIN family [Thermanaeromonas sp. C210]|uniref:putative toxin-antitoxin system toxin component, PIN family n=1 Tax=Thermanaeromonas sp. C210 TaxID=2731925 RepID=UPI00155B97CC|nr:putative toxin-antitoxin system toxin component, PIN family [Thermanaeromonas sp. C210]GFN21840.1 putative toxin-antitoxin system toxin component, PIN family protein [Thermanaeromonas sp. C210]
MKAVLDTNVLVSALLFPGGPPDRVFRAALRGHYELVVSPFIIRELARVLEQKFGYTAEEAGAVAGLVESNASTIVEPTEVPKIIASKKADNEILACALEAGADYLVTGDLKHIYPLQNVGKARIVSPSEFLAILQSEGRVAP